MTELPKLLKERYKVLSIEELDSLLLTRLMDVVDMVEDFEKCGLDDEKFFPKSALYINAIKEI